MSATWRAHGSGLLIAASSQLPFALAGALGPQLQRDFGQDDAASGLALSAFFLACALTSLPLGRLTDRIGWAASVRVAAALTCGTLLAIAALAYSWWAFGLLLAVGGMGFSIAMPASNLAMVEAAPQRLALAIGAKQAALPVSSALAGLTLPLIALTVGWRWAFVLALVPAAVAGLVAPPSARPPSPPERARPSSGRAARPALSPGIGWIGIAATFASTVPGAMLAFLVVTAVDAGLPEGLAGALLAAASVLVIVLRVVSGWIVDRTSGDGLLWTAALTAIGGVGALLLATRQPALVVAGAIVGLCGGWGWGGLLFFGVVKANPAAAGAATGVVQTGAAIGTAVGPLVFGLVAQTTNHAVAWLGAAVVSAVAAVLTVVAARSLRAQSTAAPADALV